MNNGSVSAYIYGIDRDKDVYIPLCADSSGNFVKYNHAVLIIGWDDYYFPYSNNGQDFTGDFEWKNQGAYIALNSYGTDNYYDGYIYISYDDFFVEQSLYGITDVSDDKYN